MYFVLPSEGERFYLRLLLHNVPGATSFEDLRSSNRNSTHALVQPTFQAACLGMGLLQDDAEWIQCMEEGVSMSSSSALRALFASLLVFNDVSQPLEMWELFKEHMAEDVLHQARQANPARNLDAGILDTVLRHISVHLQQLNCIRPLSEFDLPTPVAEPVVAAVAEEIGRYDQEAQRVMQAERVLKLNPQQNEIYNTIIEAVNQEPAKNAEGSVFFVDGLGGTGKTFLYSSLLSAVRARGEVAVAVASSGIAALLLEGGRTAHSTFKIPVQALCATSTCYINVDSSLAALLRAAKLIVWDEAVMMSKHNFEAVSRTLQDIQKSLHPCLESIPFGGKVVVLGGDFRQILPVIPRGSRGNVVAATLNHSKIWKDIRVLQLHSNMRVQRLLMDGATENAAAQQEFSVLLQRIGQGTQQVYPSIGEHSIRLSEYMICSGETLEDLINETYGELNTIRDPAARCEYITERAILTPLNEDADAVNILINDKYPWIKPNGEPAQRRIYKSADEVVEGEQQHIYPTEFLNSLSFPGVPPHELHLQEGSPIILMRNMTSGLANGTRLIVMRLQQRIIDAQVATGATMGQRVLIPRLSITPSDTEKLPFVLRRRQFPVRPAYAMTINKAQGQTFKRVGIYLPKPVFTHGQLCRALEAQKASRC